MGNIISRLLFKDRMTSNTNNTAPKRSGFAPPEHLSNHRSLGNRPFALAATARERQSDTPDDRHYEEILAETEVYKRQKRQEELSERAEYLRKVHEREIEPRKFPQAVFVRPLGYR